MESVVNSFLFISQKLKFLEWINQLEQPEDFPSQEDNEAGHSSQKCLSILLIIRQLMQHISNADLIHLSMVNKLWNSEARLAMRDRGSFSARLKSKYACREFLDLVPLMQNMSVIPFGGISMNLDASHARVCSMASYEAFASIHHKILDHLPWKNLSIKLAGDFTLEMKCPAFQLSIQVLQNFSESLEKLSLHVDQSSVFFLEKVIQNSKFPRLKILQYEADGADAYSYHHHIRLIQAVVSTAEQRPVELRFNKLIGLEERMAELDSVELVADYEFNPAQHLIPHSLIHKLTLKNLTLSFHRFGQVLSWEKFNTIVPLLLSSARTSLNSLRVDILFLQPLMGYGICLENLTNLKIDVGFNNEEPEILKLLQAFYFTRMFPRLKKVDVALYSCSSGPRDVIPPFVEQENVISTKPAMSGGVANITQLDFSSTASTSDDFALPVLAQMFPGIQRISLGSYETWNCVFENVRKNWTNIKELEVRAAFGKFVVSPDRLSLETINENLDAEFCGIFPEEVAQLRQMDEEYLKAVNIVPVMPSITCLRGLRTFKIICEANCYPFGKHDDTFMFTKVAGFLVFARCPDLCVVLETNSGPLARALSHVKPYASVFLTTAKGKFDPNSMA